LDAICALFAQGCRQAVTNTKNRMKGRAFNQQVLRPELEPCMTTLVTLGCNHDTSPYSQLWGLVLANSKMKV